MTIPQDKPVIEQVDPSAYAPFREGMRKRHGFCGPYRLGIAIGEAGANLPNPYTKPASMKQFDAGRATGERLRLHEEAEHDIRIAIWNAAMSGGMGQDLSQALIRRAMAEPTMKRALDAIRTGRE